MKSIDSNNPNVSHIETLAGLRGLAVLLVFLHHFPATDVRLFEFIRFAINPGYLGVDIFFVLSGFLITRILLKDKSNGKPVKNFIFRRFLRIFPIFYLTLVVIYLLDPREYVFWAFSYLSNFYYAFNVEKTFLNHTWSLCIEEHFYIFWPFLVYYLPLKTSLRVLQYIIIPVSIVLAILTCFYEDRIGTEAVSLIYRGTFYRFVSLGLGSLFAYYENDLFTNKALLRKLYASFLLSGMIILPLALLVDHQWVGLFMLIGFSMVSSFVVLFSIDMNDYNHALSNILKSKSLVYFGTISYGLYLYHYPLFYYFGLTKTEFNELGYLPVVYAFSLSFIVSALSFRYIEKPLLKYKNKFY